MSYINPNNTSNKFSNYDYSNYNNIRDHLPIDKFVIGFLNASTFGLFMALSKFHKSLPEYKFNRIDKLSYTIRCTLFWGLFYGSHMYIEQLFNLKKARLKQKYLMSNKSFIMIRDLCSAFGPVAICMPMYYFKNKHVELNFMNFMMIGIIIFGCSFYKNKDELV